MRRVHLLCALLLACMCVAVPDADAARGGRGRWIASFAAPAQAAVPNPIRAPSEATVRSIAHLSVGGSAVRIRVSNAAPGVPELRIGRVTVALQQRPGSPAVVSGSSRPVRFGGAAGVTVPAETPFVYSDPVPMPVNAGDNLAVTLHLPADTNPSAIAATWATGYRTVDGAGDATGDDDGSSYVLTFDGSYAVTGVDVRTTQAAGAIIGWGSSTFEGWGSTRDGYDRVLDLVAARVAAEVPQGAGLSVVSAGVGADTTAQGMARLDRDVFSHSGVRAMVLYNINDTGWQVRRTWDEVAADYRSIVAAAHERGIRVYCPTWGPGAQQLGRDDRYRFNQWLLSEEQPCDGVADWASALAVAPHSGGYSPLYDLYQPHYVADGIHPNPDGHAALAATTPLTWLTDAQRAAAVCSTTAELALEPDGSCRSWAPK